MNRFILLDTIDFIKLKGGTWRIVVHVPFPTLQQALKMVHNLKQSLIIKELQYESLGEESKPMKSAH